MLFAVGPAGTGKTYTSVALAVQALKEKQVKRIILTRPAVEAGENLGISSGGYEGKARSLYAAFIRRTTRYDSRRATGNSYLEKGTIQIAPSSLYAGENTGSCLCNS